MSEIPNLLNRILQDTNIKKLLSDELSKTNSIYPKELWRLALITTKTDNSWLIVPELTAVLFPSFFNFFNINAIVISKNGHKIQTLPLNISFKHEEYVYIRNIEVRTTSLNKTQLSHFLKSVGFPLRDQYLSGDGDPLSTIKSGVIIEDAKQGIVLLHSDYFVQRHVIDDDGNIIYLGLDNGKDLRNNFVVEILPTTYPRLFRTLLKKGYDVVVRQPTFIRYISYPYISDIMLPIISPPMDSFGWIDLVIDPRGVARCFVAKDNTLNQWKTMNGRLQELWEGHMKKVNNHLLGLVKDKDMLNEYFSRKEMVLRDYYIIDDLGKII